jgi:PAS domain S-box-containing protein
VDLVLGLHLQRYASAAGLVSIALVVRLLLEPVVGDAAPYFTFFLAVIASAAWLGTRAGGFALVLGAFLASFFFVPPHLAFLPMAWPDVVALAGFIVAGAAAIYALDIVRRTPLRGSKSRESGLPAELRENRLIDAAHDYAIYELDREGRILTWNKGAERLKGWKAGEIIGKPYNILHTAESRAKHAPGRELKIAAETGRFEEEAPRVRKDGSIFAAHVSLFPLRDDQGEVTGFVKITRDISDRTKAGQAILESRRRMEAIVQSAMDAVITIDEEQRIVVFNPAAEQIFGYSADEILGQPVTLLIPDRYRDAHADHVKEFFDSGVLNRPLTSESTLTALRASKEEFPIEASISQVTVGGERMGTIILRDITERKTSEEAQALLAREVDHRAKNALAVAQALVGLTKGETVEAFADAVRGRIASLARAHTLLSKSRWHGASLEQLIRDEIRPYAGKSQVTVRGPKVNCNATSVQPLGLLVHELATNAVKYGALSCESGHVSISWALDDQALTISWSERGGPPVAPPEHQGFGTRLLKQVSGRQLHAALDFDWDPGGLRAEIRLPSSLFTPESPVASKASGRPAAPQSAQASVRDQRVLIVEDEELVALELSCELSRLGWSVVGPAATLAEALPLISKGIDVAVLDVNLRGRPVYPIAAALAEREVPFLFCTGYELVDPEGRFADVPVIRKPAHPTTVSAALSSLLRSHGALNPVSG